MIFNFQDCQETFQSVPRKKNNQNGLFQKNRKIFDVLLTLWGDSQKCISSSALGITPGSYIRTIQKSF